MLQSRPKGRLGPRFLRFWDAFRACRFSLSFGHAKNAPKIAQNGTLGPPRGALGPLGGAMGPTRCLKTDVGPDLASQMTPKWAKMIPTCAKMTPQMRSEVQINELKPKQRIQKKTLKKNKLVTRDSRKVERKKYGRKKARRSFQFSKR